MSVLTPRLDKINKNYLINGGFDFFQRSVSAVNLSGTLSYVNADRFRHAFTGTMTGTPQVQRATDVPSNKIKYSQQFISRRNASTSVLQTQQRIESLNIKELLGTAVSFSAWVKPETATVVRLKLAIPTTEDGFGTLNTAFYDQTVAVSANSTWQEVKFENIVLPSTVYLGLAVDFYLESPSGTDGANTNHYITMLMLNSGRKASAFARNGRNISEELIACQRYYEKSWAPGVNPGTASDVGALSWVCSGSTVRISEPYKVTKRSNPTVTFYNPVTSTTGQIRAGTSNIAATAGNSSENKIVVDASGVTDGTVGRVHWTAEAEL